MLDAFSKTASQVALNDILMVPHRFKKSIEYCQVMVMMKLVEVSTYSVEERPLWIPDIIKAYMLDWDESS